MRSLPRFCPLTLSIFLLAPMLWAVTARPAQATGNSDAKIMLHAQVPSSKSGCSRPSNIPSTCSDYNVGVSNLSLYPTLYYTYLLVVNGSLIEGLAGLQCGIDYAGGVGAGGNSPLNVYSWTLCATLQFDTPSPAWPSPGCGTIITWDTTGPQCTSRPGNATIGAVGVAGYFYMGAYAPGQMNVTPRPVDGLAKVANCPPEVFAETDVIDPPNLGAIGFGMAGTNPCVNANEPPVPALPTSWGRIKTLVSGE